MAIKVLAVRTHYKASDGNERLSAVDWWRVQNPLTHVSKNTDIEVDFVNKVVDEKGNIEEQWDAIGREYDVIYTSYIDSPKSYAYLKAVCKMHGVKHIMDIDDNIFAADEFNPAYLRYYPGSEHLRNAEIIINDVDHLVCSTQHLADECAKRREGPISVIENYIDEKFFNAKDREHPETLTIGYMGSSTHYSDLMRTGVLWALRRLVSEYSNLNICIVGSMYEEVEKMFVGYEDQLSQVGGSRDFGIYAQDIWPKFPFDIAIAPLIDTSFNHCKSSIKYYEYGLADIAGVYSFVEPYLDKVVEGETGLFAENEQEWYYKLKWLIDDNVLRSKIKENAKRDILSNYTIDKHYSKTEEVIRSVL